jgi:hypothetical protein
VNTTINTHAITDEDMGKRRARAKAYTLVLLRPTTRYAEDASAPIVWEHGRRNMALQDAGILAIVCPVGNDQIAGVGIFTTDPDETRAIMAEDPGVKAGIFTVEVHPCRGFPGSTLPG